MKARRIFYDRMDYSDGDILEMTIWKLSAPVQAVRIARAT
jgi:hypothetical protein